METVTFHPIGIVHSPFQEPMNTPIQTSRARGAVGRVEVFEPYAAGLKDIEGFSHIQLLFHFHLSREYSLEVTPIIDDQIRGVFATRAPARPSGIGLSVVRLLSREGRFLEIADLDIVDNTPLLDIKPYVPGLTGKDEIRLGWLEKRRESLHDFRSRREIRAGAAGPIPEKGGRG